MSVLRCVLLTMLYFIGFNTVMANEPAHPDTWKIQFSGNTHYSADGIRTGLSLDRSSQRATTDDLPADQYLDVIRRRIIRGYRSNGFRDVQVSMNIDQSTDVMSATIDEGHQWVNGNVTVAGLSVRECEYVASLLVETSDQSNPLQVSQPKLKYWKRTSEMSFIDAPEQLYRQTVKEALTAIGYPTAQFSFASQDVSRNDKHTIDLQVTVSDPGTALQVGEIEFIGLQQHTPEQLTEFLKLKPGMPLTLPLRDQIVSQLLKSGRFLMVEVTHSPFYFDPSEPLKLMIHVREYDRIAPLGQEMTESQQSLMKMSEWLSNWEQGDVDLRVKYTGPTEQVNAVVQSVVPAGFHSFCNPALGTGAPGNFCIDVITSPTEGSVLMFQVTDEQGNVTLRRTLLLSKNVQGLLAWQSKKKWLHTDQLSLVCKIDLLGIWPNDGERRCALKLGYGINSDLSHGLRSEFNSTPAAAMDFFHEKVENVTAENGLKKLALTEGSLELDDSNGALRKLVGATPEMSFEVSSGKGLVAAELSRLNEETKDWGNQFQPGREWPALVSMILDDVKTAEFENSDAVLLCLDLLGNEAALKRLSEGLAQLKERRTLRIPQEDFFQSRPMAILLSFMPMVAEFVPAGSFPHRLGLTTFESMATGDNELIVQLLMELLNTETQGAIYCNLVARLIPNSPFSSQIANAGLQRLSTAEFQRDMAPFVDEPGHVREVICAFLVWLQQTSDKDAEKIAELVEKHITPQNGRPLNVRPLLVLIRSQHDKSPEDVLASLVPVVWDGGLKSWIEADLTSLAKPVSNDTKKYFGASSTQILNELTEKKQTPSLPKIVTPARPVSRSKSLNGIPLEEDWDLDKTP